jgi:hypothetical protein
MISEYRILKKDVKHVLLTPAVIDELVCRCAKQHECNLGMVQVVSHSVCVERIHLELAYNAFQNLRVLRLCGVVLEDLRAAHWQMASVSHMALVGLRHCSPPHRLTRYHVS